MSTKPEPWPATAADLVDLMRAIRAVNRVRCRMIQELPEDSALTLAVFAAERSMEEIYDSHSTGEEKVQTEASLDDEEAITQKMFPGPSGERPDHLVITVSPDMLWTVQDRVKRSIRDDEEGTELCRVHDGLEDAWNRLVPVTLLPVNSLTGEVA